MLLTHALIFAWSETPATAQAPTFSPFARLGHSITIDEVNDGVSQLLGDDLVDATDFADNFASNGSSFQVIIADLDGDGEAEDDEIVGSFIDYGDLYEFNIYFEEITARSQISFTSVELSKQHVFAGANEATSGWRLDAFHDRWSAGLGEEVRGVLVPRDETFAGVRNERVRGFLNATSISLYGTGGLRWIRIQDEFSWDARGSILGRTAADVRNDHHIFGPQLGFGTVAENGMFRLEAVALGLVGYGHFDSQLTGIFGQAAIPGALNNSINARSTNSLAEREDDYVAWHGETRVTASCQLTQRLRFDATWRWIATGPVYRAYDSMNYTAPTFTLRDIDGDTAYGSDWFVGLTYTH
ncbi:MAG: hypothetical protein AAF266_08370 [Planctomycetota bacterium]